MAWAIALLLMFCACSCKQECNEVRWRLERNNLSPPCSNLSSFGSKWCWRKWLWHCWDFSAPRTWLGARVIVPPPSPLRYAPGCKTSLKTFRNDIMFMVSMSWIFQLEVLCVVETCITSLFVLTMTIFGCGFK